MSRIDRFREIDGKRYAWDGKVYDARFEAVEVAEGFMKEGFEARVESYGDSYLVLLRRHLEVGLL